MPIHRWTGLALGIVGLASALTGSGLAFRNELDPIVYPANFSAHDCAQTVVLDDIVRRARALRPRGAIDYVRVRGASAPVIVRFTNEDTLYFDRCDGALSASQNRDAGFFGTLEYIHRGQWITNGGWIMGAGAGAMLLMCATGIYCWWPRNPRRFVQGFLLDRRLKGNAFHLGLHRTTGAWAALLLALSATTALPIAFGGLKDAVESVGVRAPPPRILSPQPAAGVPSFSLQEALALVQRLSPSPRDVLMHLPRKPRDPLAIFIIDADAPHADARSSLYLNARSGQVLRYIPYAQSGLGRRLFEWILAVHTGQVGGVLGRFALVIGALGVPALAYTGALTYVRKALRKRATQRNAAIASAASAASSGR